VLLNGEARILDSDIEAYGGVVHVLDSVLQLPVPAPQTVRARPGRLSAHSVSHSKSILYVAFVWARRALNRPKRRFPARAVMQPRAVRHSDCNRSGPAGAVKRP
jgi:hypothetical protein